jgi:hypothetical protein
LDDDVGPSSETREALSASARRGRSRMSAEDKARAARACEALGLAFDDPALASGDEDVDGGDSGLEKL